MDHYVALVNATKTPKTLECVNMWYLVLYVCRYAELNISFTLST